MLAQRGVAEHVEESGLEEGVELGEGLAALGPQGVRRIQNPRNPLLLRQRRQGKRVCKQRLPIELGYVRPGRMLECVVKEVIRPQQVRQKFSRYGTVSRFQRVHVGAANAVELWYRNFVEVWTNL